MNDSYNQSPPPHTTNSGPSDWVPPVGKQGPPAGAKFFHSLRTSGFYRSDERWIGGVAGGLAHKYGLDPLIVRVGFILLTLLWGGGLIFYAAAWALLPEQRDGRIHAQEAIRGNFSGAQLLIAALVITGFSLSGAFFIGVGYLPPFIEALFWIAFTAAVIVAAVIISGRVKPTAPQGGQQPPAPQPWAAQTSQNWNASAPVDHGYPVADSTSPMPHMAPTAQTDQAAPMAQAAYTTPIQAAWETPPATTESATPYVWTPPTPTKLPVKHPGVAQFGILLGVFLLGAALILLVNHTGAFATSLEMVGILSGLALSLGGLTVIINGFRGRTSGSAGFFGILGGLAAIAASGALILGIGSVSAQTHLFTDLKVNPSTVSEFSDGFAFGAGDYTLNLSSLDLSDIDTASGPLEIPISAGAGQIEIIVPADMAVTADLNMVAGSIVVRNPETQSSTGGLGNLNTTYQSPAVTAGAPAALHLNINMAAGEIRFTEED